MDYQIKKLDARFKAWKLFDYYVEPIRYNRVDGFLELREWCWETFGPGADIDMFIGHGYGYNKPERMNNYKWAWHDSEYRIYLKDGPELTVLELKWV